MDYYQIMQQFNSHGFITSYFENGQEASKYLSEQIVGRTVGFGGSKTLSELGLYEILSKNNVVVWHHHIQGDEVKKLAACCQIYITSANAVSASGEIVNIDGAGNRIALTLYGPEKVYYVVGKNKVKATREAAIQRAKNIAGPQNAKRLKVKTPCAVHADKCYDCQSDERICNVMAIIDRSPNRVISEIIFINEDLGF